LGLTPSIPYYRLFIDLRILVFAPAYILIGHLLSGAIYVINAKWRNALAFVRSSLLVYHSWGSWRHLHVAVLTAVWEESLFRYLLLFWLLDITNSPMLATVSISLLFALSHLSQWNRKEIRNSLDLFTFAVTLSIITLLTHSLYPALIIHIVRNYILRCLLIPKSEYNRLHRTKTM
jgi:membrane protease YdiL (CAAX protease family)